MKQAIDVIKRVAEKSERVMLFHSASGKDSIALLDLLHPHFKEIICVYMYVVKDLQHINRYIAYATRKYKNARFIQIPHFAVYTYIKTGYLGCTQNEKQRKYTMSQLGDALREQLDVDWIFIGFKQSDSMNRRLMLRGYEDEAINEDTMRCYPLSQYKNADVLRYIERENLISPERYCSAQSAGTNISDINYLLFLREQYPEDLQKVIAEYPLVERILFEHDYKEKSTQGECNQDNKAL